ncbi:MAG: SlyX family protein [Pseudomonadota bacterium]|nr:SlyX family protein [Pseudomonadota bacterium]
MPPDSLEEVQSKIAYLEHAVAEIGEVVFRQHREIQALEAKISALTDRLEIAASPEMRSADTDPPPHY